MLKRNLYTSKRKNPLPILPSMILIILITIVSYYIFIDKNNQVFSWLFSKLPNSSENQPQDIIRQTLTPGLLLNTPSKIEMVSKLIPISAVVQVIGQVETDNKVENKWLGSGTIISKNGLILTNDHNVASTKGSTIKDIVISVTTNQNQTPVAMYYASIVQADRNLDLAILQITQDMNHNPINKDTLDLKFVPIGDSNSISTNNTVYFYFYPLIEKPIPSITSGNITSFIPEDPFGPQAFIKTDASTNGSYGSLVANDKGEIIGISTQYVYSGMDALPAGCAQENDPLHDLCSPGISAFRPISLSKNMIDKALNGEISPDQSEQINNEDVTNKMVPVYKDDFSKPSTSWSPVNPELGSVSISDKSLILQILPQMKVNPVIHGPFLADSITTALVENINNQSNGGFGLICRANDTADTYYGLEISSDGYNRIYKMVQGKTYFLTSWIPINLSGNQFSMTFSCIGQKFIGILNGNIIAKASDSQFSDGKNGIFASSFEEGNFSVKFSKYLVLSDSIPPTPSFTPTETRTPTNTKTIKPTKTPQPTRTISASSTNTITVTSTQQPTLVPTKSNSTITSTPPPQKSSVTPLPPETLISITPELNVLESGIVDDNNQGLTYKGQWFIYNNNKAGNGSIHFSNNIGNSVTFNFTGTKFTLGYTSGISQGVIQIIIDGKNYIYFNESEPEIGWRRTWFSPTFSNGNHKVTIT